MTKSNEQCAGKCGSTLAVTNTNPDRLCGKCQKILDPRFNNARYKAWIEAGKPPAASMLVKFPVQPKPRTGGQVAAPRKYPNPADLPTPYLLQCHKELMRRAKIAQQEAALLATFVEAK